MDYKSINLILKISIISSFIFSFAKTNANSMPSREALDFCRNSPDFRECLKDFNSVKTTDYDLDENDELDFLGLPKLDRKEWMTIKNKPMNHVMYLSKKAWKIKVRGIYGRYLTYRRVSRMYMEPVPVL